jgi:hypothetical protein
MTITSWFLPASSRIARRAVPGTRSFVTGIVAGIAATASSSRTRYARSVSPRTSPMSTDAQ